MPFEGQLIDEVPDYGNTTFQISPRPHHAEHAPHLQAPGITRIGPMGLVDYPADFGEGKLAPTADWSDMCESHHFVQFYESDTFLLDSLRGFIGKGLRMGETCMVIATKAHSEGIEERLQADGLDVAAHAATGQYISLDAAEVLSSIMREGAPDPELFAEILGERIARATEGQRCVRIFGEMVALLWEAGNHTGAIQLEALWNDLHHRLPFSLFCGYPMSGFEGQALTESLHTVCTNHARVIPAESYSAVDGSDQRLRVIALLQQKASSLQDEIEARKRVEEALHQSLRLRDEFLSAVSHDLRSPLTIVQGQSQVLQRLVARGNVDGDGLRKGLKQIESKSRAMAELIDELLDVTRLRAGEQLQLDRRMVDLVALVQDVIAGQEEATPNHQLVLRTTETDLTGVWDRQRLRRVVENIVTNAVKYSPEGGQIVLTLTREEGPAGTCAVLVVQDQGIGIPQNDLPHIFERYYRANNATTEIAGTGLGLAGARQIVEQHGGTIAASSQENLGATFTVLLPLGLPSQPASADPTAGTHPSAAGA